jgi:hypothetical protein
VVIGLFSFVGSLLGAGASKKASRRAEAAQLDFLNRALGLQEQQYAQDRADFTPYREAGTEALGRQGDFLGLNGNDAQGSAIDSLMASPWYQALYRNGLEANLQNASATGGIRGGNEVRSLADFGSDTLATSIDRMLAQLSGVSAQGLGATGTGAALGANNINQQASNLGAQGQVRAGGLLTRGGINSQLWNNAGSMFGDLASMIPGLGPFAKMF